MDKLIFIFEEPRECPLCKTPSHRLAGKIPICWECTRSSAVWHDYAMSGGMLSNWASPEEVDWSLSEQPPAREKKKKKISCSLRKRVFERDAYRCQECNDHKDLCADHIFPESLGGVTTFENLQTLCRKCNSKKGVSVPDKKC